MHLVRSDRPPGRHWRGRAVGKAPMGPGGLPGRCAWLVCLGSPRPRSPERAGPDLRSLWAHEEERRLGSLQGVEDADGI